MALCTLAVICGLWSKQINGHERLILIFITLTRAALICKNAVKFWNIYIFFFVINIFYLFFTHNNITSTQNKQNKTTDTYSMFQKSNQRGEREGGKKQQQNRSFLHTITFYGVNILTHRFAQQQNLSPSHSAIKHLEYTSIFTISKLHSTNEKKQYHSHSVNDMQTLVCVIDIKTPGWKIPLKTR